MAIPSRKQQIERVLDALELWHDEEKTLQDIAEAIVDGYLDLLGSAIKKPVMVPHVGMAFNHPALSGVWHVAHDMGGGQMWIVSATSKYGAVIPVRSQFWEYANQSTAKAGAPGNNKDGWTNMDTVSRRQRQFIYDIVCVSDKGALLQGDDGSYLQESNENLAQYYRKEFKVGGIEW